MGLIYIETPCIYIYIYWVSRNNRAVTWVLCISRCPVQLGLVTFLFNGISNCNGKCIIVEEHQWFYLTHEWGYKEIHAFPKGISPKVNVIAQLEFNLAYDDVGVQLVNPYAMGTSPRNTWYHITMCKKLFKETTQKC